MHARAAAAAAWQLRQLSMVGRAALATVAAEAPVRFARLAGELFADDGYGGRRIGGTATARWPVTRRVSMTSTLAVVDVAGASPRADGTVVSALGAAAWQVDAGIALFATADLSSSPTQPLAVRTLAVLDLAFEPDL